MSRSVNCDICHDELPSFWAKGKSLPEGWIELIDHNSNGDTLFVACSRRECRGAVIAALNTLA